MCLQMVSISSVSFHCQKLDYVIDVLILVRILEFSPHANVARNISPVPVLNCELFMAQSHTEKEFCPFMRLHFGVLSL